MAWSPVLSAQSSSEGADQANKAVTLQLVQKIHYYIECCLLQGLTLDETTVALQHLGVQERLTRITWKQLEVQNPKFFCNYTKELALKAGRHLLVSTDLQQRIRMQGCRAFPNAGLVQTPSPS